MQSQKHRNQTHSRTALPKTLCRAAGALCALCVKKNKTLFFFSFSN